MQVYIGIDWSVDNHASQVMGFRGIKTGLVPGEHLMDEIQPGLRLGTSRCGPSECNPASSLTMAGLEASGRGEHPR